MGSLLYATEYKNETQLNDIKNKIESLTNKKIIEIRCERTLEDKRWFISLLLEDKICMSIIASKDNDYLNTEIENLCERYKEKYGRFNGRHRVYKNR